MMDFSPQDLRRLYGELLFVVPEKAPPAPDRVVSSPVAPTLQTPPVAPPSVPLPRTEETKPPVPEAPAAKLPVAESPLSFPYLQSGPAIVWKMKPQARLALILSAPEFGDRRLTALLRDLVLEAGIDADYIGFGVMPEGSDRWDFSPMPVAMGIICYTFPERPPQPVTLDGKAYYVAAPLARIAQDDRYRQAMLRLLGKVKAALDA